MLTNLHIRNYALIEALDITFQSGLTAITGETGAGKSIILGAVGLILGNRADTKVLHIKDTNCVVEGSFDISNYGYQAFFDKHDLDYSDELVIRREISKSGKSRSFVNDSLVNLTILNELKELLVNLHKQFDHLELYQASFQLDVIDALAKNKKIKDAYLGKYNEYNDLRVKLEKLKKQRQKAQSEQEFLLFQYEEFENLDLQIGEQEEREQELDKLNNAEEIKSITFLTSHTIEEDENSITNQLREISYKLESVSSFDPKLEELYERLSSCLEELRDISSESAQIGDGVEHDPKLISEHQERLDKIYQLQKKHQKLDIDGLLEFQRELEEKIAQYQNIDEDINKIEKQLGPLKESLQSSGENLRKSRVQISKSFEDNVRRGLIDLGMEHAKIKVQFSELEEPSPIGMDEIIFLFAPNKGSEFLPLKDIASGGETSRLTLIIKSLVAGALTMPTMIFDEIDLGISGEIAIKMGKVLNYLAARHQLITISHSAQISASANHHYHVFKKETPDRVITGLHVLDHEGRVQEVAKMLSGDPPSSHAIENAKELLA